MNAKPGMSERTDNLRRVRRAGWMAALLAAVVAVGLWLPAAPAPAAPSAQTGWPAYLADAARDSASAASIGPVVSPEWTHVVSGFIASEPIIVNQRVYVTAWDGYLHALDQNDGHELWHTFLGTYRLKPQCPGSPYLLGVTATPAFDAGTNLLYASAMSATVVFTDGTPFDRDTGPYLYAIDPGSGEIQWQAELSPNSDNYAWSSPLVANGHAYVGVASQGDCPLTQGQLLSVALTGTHTIQRAVMAPDSLAVYPPNLVATGILTDGSNYNFTATAIIDFHGPQSAGMSIHLRHLNDNQSYQPQLYSRITPRTSRCVEEPHNALNKTPENCSKNAGLSRPARAVTVR